MKNARNMYSKKTLNNENHTKTVWQLPHTQAAANLAKSKPATLVKHCCPDLEHRTITTPTLYTLHPAHLHHCTPYVVPLCHLHFGTAPPTSYYGTVPLDCLHRAIVPSTSYHCTPYIVPLYPLHRTVAPHLSYLLYREIAPATWYHCARYIVPLHPYTSYHCTPYVAPLYLSYCTSCTWCTCATVPLRCLHCTIAPALRTPVPALYTP